MLALVVFTLALVACWLLHVTWWLFRATDQHPPRTDLRREARFVYARVHKQAACSKLWPWPRSACKPRNGLIRARQGAFFTHAVCQRAPGWGEGARRVGPRLRGRSAGASAWGWGVQPAGTCCKPDVILAICASGAERGASAVHNVFAGGRRSGNAATQG